MKKSIKTTEFSTIFLALALGALSSSAFSAVVEISDTPGSAGVPIPSSGGWINANLQNCCDTQVSRKRFDLGQFEAGQYTFNIDYLDLPTVYDHFPVWSSSVFLVTSSNNAFVTNKDTLWEWPPYDPDCDANFPYCWPSSPWPVGEVFSVATPVNVVASRTLSGSKISESFTVNLEAGIAYYLLVSDTDDYLHWKSSGFTITADVTPTVPVPATAWLMGSALLGLLGVAKRKR